MFNNMSPIRTVITTITRKSVNMVAEPDNDTAPTRILDTSGHRLEDYSTVAKAATRRLQWRWTQRLVQHKEQLFN